MGRFSMGRWPCFYLGVFTCAFITDKPWWFSLPIMFVAVVIMAATDPKGKGL